MVYNDTSTKQGIIQACEFFCGLNDAAISGSASLLAHFTRIINTNYHKVVTMILDSEDGWDWADLNQSGSGESTLTKNTTGGTGYVKLALSDKILKVKSLEITYDGSNWKKATPLQLNESSAPFDANSITQNFSVDSPFYYQNGLFVYLFPTPVTSVTGGVKMWTVKEGTEFTAADTTAEPGFDEPFHNMIAVGASLDFALAKGRENKNELAGMYADYERRLRVFYGNKQESETLVMKAADMEMS